MSGLGIVTGAARGPVVPSNLAGAMFPDQRAAERATGRAACGSAT
jgi:hypothetical protein